MINILGEKSIFKAFSTFTYNLKRLSRKILRGGNILQREKHNPPLSYHLLSSFPLSVCLLVLGFVFFTQSHYVFQVGLRLKISLLGLQVLGLQSFITALVHILKGCSVKVNSQGCMSPLVPSEGGHTEKGTMLFDFLTGIGGCSFSGWRWPADTADTAHAQYILLSRVKSLTACLRAVLVAFHNEWTYDTWNSCSFPCAVKRGSGG